MELPEKQGLKQPPAVLCPSQCRVAVELPEKQGLKRHKAKCISYKGCCSGTSRKTRIETFIKNKKNARWRYSELQKNKVETQSRQTRSTKINELQWNFQKNKD